MATNPTGPWYDWVATAVANRNAPGMIEASAFKPPLIGPTSSLAGLASSGWLLVRCRADISVMLQNRHRIRWLSRMRPVTYMVFDLPYLNGKSLMASPFSYRREALQELIERFRLPGVLVPEICAGPLRKGPSPAVSLSSQALKLAQAKGNWRYDLMPLR